ncbi:hypothetical protein [Parapedobacter sp. 2B3]|uniref:hypothetical protein n=1 Tax=Parapedobacter sp. 2B3 TaxID=3342381 RepID=UPI0035B6099F
MTSDRLRAVLFWVLLGPAYVAAQSVADTGFRYTAARPHYSVGKGSLILYDGGHNNPLSLKGQYSAFGRVLEADGYRLATHSEPITAKSLADARVFVTVNAMYDLEKLDLPTGNVYTDEEIETLYTWVYQHGGSLFLITDHMPCAGSVSKLAERFGFNLINGFAQRKDGLTEIFSRRRGNLTANVVTDVEGAVIDSIRIWGGTGFFPPPEAVVISSLGEDYEVFLPVQVAEMNHHVAPTIPKISGTGLANGAILQCGRGRVCVFADGAPFTAQLQGIKSDKRGMNHPDATQNAQLLLNIVHWLDTAYR